MATYAIGDIQGCMESLERLLKEIAYDSDQDRLWFTGDLVNRGPRSKDVLEWVKEHDDRVVTVLGNHEIHLMARFYGIREKRGRDTLDGLLGNSRSDMLLDWLRTRPLLYQRGRFLLVHAGLLPSWSLAEATERAREAEALLQSDRAPELIELIFQKDSGGDGSDSSSGMSSLLRAAQTINVMTRIRVCSADGSPDYAYSASPRQIPNGSLPWYSIKHPPWPVIIFGHWALHGLHTGSEVMAIDTGAVWGGLLTALRLEDLRVFQVEGHSN